MIDLLEAVESLRVIEATYNNKVRELEIHAVGIGTDGTTLVRAYERHDEFKLFKYDKLQNIILLEKTFYVRPEYNKDDIAMKEIFFQI